ncbi:hypothetical protein Fcan01_11808 [Folsomia candida]|uniref:Integrase catalytic domain-containing protein n=1 Tax=Folsomia candida TaxID=158441 RepID=A0A226EAP5_FOLCA|nr:hypothetical protein Fcan01_11808 [Folsomia candida]
MATIFDNSAPIIRSEVVNEDNSKLPVEVLPHPEYQYNESAKTISLKPYKEPDHLVAPVNNIGHSLFSQCDCFINDFMVSQTNNLYAYRAITEAILNYGAEYKKCQGGLSLYTHEINPHAFQTQTEDGFKHRYEAIKENNAAAIGGSNLNPFAFDHFDISYFSVLVDDEQICFKPLKLDFGNNQSLLGFYTLLTSSGVAHQDLGIGVNREDYIKSSEALFAFNLCPAAEDDVFSIHKTGNIRFDIQFKNPLPKAISVIVYAEFNSVKVAEARPLKNKCGTVVARAFEEVLKETRTHPLKLQVDMGKEFYSAPFQEIYKKYNIHMFSVFSEIKNSICERFNRTLMDKIARYWTYSNSFKYVDVLPDIISNYNNSFHRSIGRVPLKVTKENEQEIENSILNYRLTRRNQSFKSMILFEFHVIKICSQKDITKIGQKNVSE